MSPCISHGKSHYSPPAQILPQQPVLVTRSLLQLGVKGPPNIFSTLGLLNVFTISNAVLVAV